MSKTPAKLWSLAPLLLAVSCGQGDDSSEKTPGNWAHQVHNLDITPGCYISPPTVAIPSSTSEAVVDQTKSSMSRRLTLAVGCVARYQAIIGESRAQPERLEWRSSDEALDVSVAESPTEHGGSFRLDLKRGQNIAQDDCLFSRAEMSVFGEYSSDFSAIRQDGLSVYWRENVVMLSRPGPFGQMVSFYRGCDEETGVSFGALPSYTADSEPISCWDGAGQFVSCEGVSTWPYVANE